MKRATVIELGGNSFSNGKIFPVSSNFEEFISTIQTAFANPELATLFTERGAVICDVDVIKDDEILYILPKGVPFVPPPSRNFGSSSNQISSEWIKLNVGGTLFHVSKTTILSRDSSSLLALMFDPSSQIQPSIVDTNGAYLMDREPKYFAPLLNYLRTGKLLVDDGINLQGILEEAQFFDIRSAIPLLEEMMLSKDDRPLTRRDVVKALITTANIETLRFQGVNLSGADLSYLDLRNINLKYAKLRQAKLSYCNLSFCNFERADMSGVEMNCAILSGVRMACANMERAHCVNCNFQDPSGRNANMEGVNLRNAVLEDSDLTGANLRVANLKGANLKSTILRGAILAGADLEKSDLTGSDLHEANLRGANLKDAALELMINPLHMAQAIR